MHITALPFSVFRTPLLPYSTVDKIDKAKLAVPFQNPVLQEAIFLASPSLYTTMQEWLEGKMKDAKKIEKLEISLAKYLLRMSYRCTPFGLFAGITHITHLSGGSKPPDRLEFYRHTRLDMDYLCALSNNLTKNAEIREKLLYFPNNTIYEVGENLRYAEYRIYKKSRNHFLISIDNSVYVQRILEVAKNGALPKQLAEAIVEDDISFDDAIDFVYEMIDSQVLSSELEPHITGEEYFDRLLAKNLPVLGIFNEINETLRQIDRQPFGTAIPQYYEIAEKLKSLGTDFELGQLFQVDIKKAIQVAIPQTVIDDLAATIELLLATVQYKEHPNLKKFKELFSNRYETQEMPLLQVLDNETGMGYPPQDNHQADNSPLLDGIGVGFGGQNQVNSYEWTPFQQFITEKYINALANKEKIITITKTELQGLALVKQPYSPTTSLHCFASILATKTEGQEENKQENKEENSEENKQDEIQYQVYLKGVSGPSAATLLGRFCHLDDNLAENIKQALVEEAASNPDAVFAEIVHINQGRIGNISMRPQLRNYEIPILVQADTNSENTVLLGDLMVSIKNNRIFLRSKTLNKEVIPRLSSAHNFGANALPFYHFLCELQFQNCITGYHWNWGMLANRDILPRVVYENKVILSKARWILKANEITPIANAVANSKGEEQLPKLKELLAKKELPRFVILVEGDNELPIDIENDLCLAVLLDFVKPNRQIVLQENLMTQAEVYATKDDTGGFTNEFVFPLQYSPKEVVNSTPKNLESFKNLEDLTPRNFAVGSSWLYLKIYCGVKTADKILSEIIKPLTEKYLANSDDKNDKTSIEKWFFIRYTDPQHHIRLRMYKEDGNFGEILKELHQLLQPYLHTIRNKDAKKMLSDKFRTERKAITELLTKEFVETDDIFPMIQIFEQRSQSLKPIIATILEQNKSQILGITLNDLNNLLGSYVHMFINRFLRSKQRQHELVIYDFLVQFYTSQLARTK